VFHFLPPPVWGKKGPARTEHNAHNPHPTATQQTLPKKGTGAGAGKKGRLRLPGVEIARGIAPDGIRTSPEMEGDRHNPTTYVRLVGSGLTGASRGFRGRQARRSDVGFSPFGFFFFWFLEFEFWGGIRVVWGGTNCKL
jgi:hypothetical protein